MDKPLQFIEALTAKPRRGGYLIDKSLSIDQDSFECLMDDPLQCREALMAKPLCGECLALTAEPLGGECLMDKPLK